MKTFPAWKNRSESEELSDVDSPLLGELLPDGSGVSLGSDGSLPTSLVDGEMPELTPPLDRPSLVDESLLSEDVAESLESKLADEDAGGETPPIVELDSSPSLESEGLLLGFVPDERTA